MEKLKETAVFMVGGIKRLMFAFHRLEEASLIADVSLAVMFYFDSIYNYVSAWFLLKEKKTDPRGGTFFYKLSALGQAHLLDDIYKLLESPFGKTNFGEVIRLYRNKALIHAEHDDSDVDEVYALVDMEDMKVQEDFHGRVALLKVLCHKLAYDLLEAADIEPETVGLGEPDPDLKVDES